MWGGGSMCHLLFEPLVDVLTVEQDEAQRHIVAQLDDLPIQATEVGQLLLALLHSEAKRVVEVVRRSIYLAA